jgi:hypothetical protein
MTVRDVDENSLLFINAIARNVVDRAPIFAPMAIHPVLFANFLQFSIFSGVVTSSYIAS